MACACLSSMTKPTPVGFWRWCWNEPVAVVVTAGQRSAQRLRRLPRRVPTCWSATWVCRTQDGFDLIRHVRGDGYDARDLPAVALTAFVQKNDAHLALLAGFQVHLPKPVDSHDLTSVVARLAGKGSLVGFDCEEPSEATTPVVSTDTIGFFFSSSPEPWRSMRQHVSPRS